MCVCARGFQMCADLIIEASRFTPTSLNVAYIAVQINEALWCIQVCFPPEQVDVTVISGVKVMGNESGGCAVCGSPVSLLQSQVKSPCRCDERREQLTHCWHLCWTSEELQLSDVFVVICLLG